MDIQHFRRSYNFTSLDREDLDDNPFEQFRSWFEAAIKANITEPNAMALTTVSKEGKPSCRMVLMKQFDQAGLVFYTNLNSRKAQEIKHTGCAAVTFFWKELERQVHIEGKVDEISREDVYAYFKERPRGSQLSTWVSAQDQVITSRKVLEEAYNQAEQTYLNQSVPLPETWGGFRIIPNVFEFWQGRPDRLHDRFQYTLAGSSWTIQRLSP
jgi:pyridoxamine 5'-phosphate oxidase